MKGGRVVLSGRLAMLAGMVTPGSPVADVGCDHGFLPIYLVQNQVSPRAFALDVREGPLAAAREHIEGCGLGTYIETRLSDGLAGLKAGEAETLICAGMGGRLVQRILSADMEKVRGMREVILQPQSELREFRMFLRREGFCTLAEDAVYDGGKYYFAVKAVYAGKGCAVGSPSGGSCQRTVPQSRQGRPGSGRFSSGPEIPQSVFDEYGELLLCHRHPVLRQYLAYRKEGAERILEKLEAEGGPRAAGRILQFRQELAEIETALGLF